MPRRLKPVTTPFRRAGTAFRIFPGRCCGLPAFISKQGELLLQVIDNVHVHSVSCLCLELGACCWQWIESTVATQLAFEANLAWSPFHAWSNLFLLGANQWYFLKHEDPRLRLQAWNLERVCASSTWRVSWNAVSASSLARNATPDEKLAVCSDAVSRSDRRSSLVQFAATGSESCNCNCFDTSLKNF